MKEQKNLTNTSCFSSKNDSKLAGLCEVCQNPTEDLKIDCGRWKCPLCRPHAEGRV